MNKNFIFILLGITLITYSSIQIASNNTIFYFTTSEAFQSTETSESERLKLGGFVVRDSISKTSNAETRFTVTDGNKDVVIIFDGFIPDLFQEEMGVILDGYFQNQIFYSDDMLVKHDNEYISEDGQSYDVENYSK
ncbi:cytochrome c maturation protein CcmE [Acidimicrobiia bacterium]|nr:cytochrome c maturation protein CcmE [Candidatus Actinomarina sp.]MDB4249572.1 cytochrome c maturation protein CcmE [Acidimicrobiia bacterium]